MNRDVRPVMLSRLCLFRCLSINDLITENEIAQETRAMLQVSIHREREHVGISVFIAITRIEVGHLVTVNQLNTQLRAVTTSLFE